MGDVMIMKLEYDMDLDGRTVHTSWDGRVLDIDGERYRPSSCSLDTRRVTPLWIAVTAAFLFLLSGMFVGALFGRPDIAIISTAAGFTAGAMTLLLLSRMEQVLEVSHADGTLILRGNSSNLGKLYYEMSKVTIRRLREREREAVAAMKGAGMVKGDSILDRDEISSVRNDMKRRSVLVGNRMVAKICPQCGNDELYYEGGMMTGHVYHCKRCDYIGPLVFEKELDLKSR